MARSLQEKLDTLDPERRAGIETEADKLHSEYLTLQQLRKAQSLTQTQLAQVLGVRQATVAKYERQTDLLMSTLSSYVEAMGGHLKIVVEFPGKEQLRLDGFGQQWIPPVDPAGRRRKELRPTPDAKRATARKVS